MTDYFGNVIEVEVVNGVPTLAVTRDRSASLRKALEKLGFPPLLPRNAEEDARGLVNGLASNDPSDPRYDPGEEYLEFDPSVDPTGLQDTLDSLSFTRDRHIVRQVL